MRLRTFAVSTVACATVLGVGLPMVPAAAADATTLYVDNAVTCSDTGTGTADLPYCTISAAAGAVTPGQTVLILDGWYGEHVSITRSGTQQQPIVFTSAYPGTDEATSVLQPPTGTGPAITVSGAHDVVVRNLVVYGSADGLQVTDSSRISIDHDSLVQNGTGPDPAVRLSGATSGVTVSRNSIYDSDSTSGPAIQVDSGVPGTVITTNEIDTPAQGAVLATDAPGTVVTSNTVSKGCDLGISLLGASSGSTVENNVAAPDATCAAGSPVGVTVAAAAVSGTTADYNVFHPLAGGAPYRWNNAVYPTQAAFQQATGQGAHDSTADPLNQSGSYQAGSPAIDSADASAPGELAGDIDGTPAVDDLQQPNTGTGIGYRDRGAHELQGLTSVGLAVDRSQGAHPMTVNLTASATDQWAPTSTSYAYDFGDGTPVVTSSSPKVAHVYTSRGTFEPVVTVTDNFGSRMAAGTDAPVVVGDPGPPHAVLSVTPAFSGLPLTYTADPSKSTGPWPIVSQHVDFGDGSAPATCASASDACTHTYAAPGTYQVTATVTDSVGGTGTVTQSVTAAYQPSRFAAMAQRILDTRSGLGAPAKRLGPDSEMTLDVSNILINGTIPTRINATAVVLNLTAVGPTDSSFLTVYPTGQPRPVTSNSNFVAGQDTAHLVTVPVGVDGTVKIYNHSGSLDLVADLVGDYNTSERDRFTAVTPTRVLDTRTGQGSGQVGKVGPKGSVCFPVPVQPGHPSGVDTVALNLTATDGDQQSFLAANPVSDGPSSNLNFGPGQTVSNQAIVLTENGSVCVHNANGNTNVVADLIGYYDPTADSEFTPIVPTRLVDTRNGAGTPIGPDSALPVQVAGTAGIPASATGAVLNVTATGPDLPGFLAVYPDGRARPNTSSVNFATGQTVPNLVTTGLGTNGQVDVYNHSGHTQAIVDAFGYFAKP
ncbi:right-handed parallel beta-helix repeat-containing protein [Kitasatospora mediocidica]|uniref:right-handed parallel beta-helix repeat-containing protein n=1 Tax=Kitasatospora mediocidica TaxID=58352 RepID=UPI0009FC3E70|nr:right-handed parallel beta-helix repeat-containing protein [Kitasatospora mediocidica]